MIYGLIDWFFGIFMWMLIEPDGRKFFWFIDSLFIIVGVSGFFLTRDRNKDKS